MKLPKRKVRFRTLAETNKLIEKYRGMPKWKYMVLRGWANLFVMAVFVFLLTWGTEPVWVRLLWLWIAMLNAFQFARWEASWDHWQTLRTPTVAQAEAMRDQMREMAAHERDPFDQQMMYEIAKEMDQWLSGEGEL